MSITHNFNFLSWNVTGLMSSSSYLSYCLLEHTIYFCGISEHWLYNYNLHLIDAIDNRLKSHAVSDFDLVNSSRRGVGKGGVCIMWHVKYDKYITPLTIDDDIIVGIVSSCIIPVFVQFSSISTMSKSFYKIL